MPSEPSASNDQRICALVDLVLAEGGRLYRDFPWRRTHDPYAVLVSEVMLQQTQVTRVVRYYERWLESFPTLEILADAPLEAVLRAWQGLGYNRRAIALKRLAEQVAEAARTAGTPAELPADEAALRALPGVGPATAAGVLAFAFGQPMPYLETNVRTVLLHELFADREGVSDVELRPIVAAAAEEAAARGVDPRTWNYALLDYGAHLKRTVPNPSRRSAHHGRQSVYEGSTRQKRAHLLRLLIDQPGADLDLCVAEIASADVAAGRDAPSPGEVLTVLEALADDGFIESDGTGWRIR